MNAKSDVAGVATKMFGLLEPLSADERQRAFAAAQALLGSSLGPVVAQQVPIPGAAETTVASLQATSSSAQNYFAQKQAHSPAEMLAVAARFRELSANAMEHSKDDLKAVCKEARRSFDSTHFARDVGNARTRGFFTRAKEITLSDYGQKFIDFLPDRAAAGELKKPVMKKRKKKAGT